MEIVKSLKVTMETLQNYFAPVDTPFKKLEKGHDVISNRLDDVVVSCGGIQDKCELMSQQSLDDCTAIKICTDTTQKVLNNDFGKLLESNLANFHLMCDIKTRLDSIETILNVQRNQAPKCTCIRGAH